MSVVERHGGEVWRLWQEGFGQREISRELGVSRKSVSRIVVPSGGIPPAPRRRAVRALSFAEREEISRGLSAGKFLREIARELGRDVSVISREIARNGGHQAYRAAEADQAAWQRARRPKTPKLAGNPQLAAVVADGLEQRWAPQQIAATLRRDYPNDPEMQVSHETIYQSLFVQAKATLKTELAQYLRRKQRLRRPRAAAARAAKNTNGRGQIPDRVPLSQRPPEATDRAVPDHWEGDLILGSRGSAVVTLAERHSRYLLLIALPHGKTAEAVRDALAHGITRLPALLDHDLRHHHRLNPAAPRKSAVDLPQHLSIQDMWKSVTWDQGKEMSQHARFTIDTGVQVYFCPPGQPWLRGTNENTNGLARDYLPKGTDLRPYTQEDLDNIAHQLNTRPRQTLNWMTPSEALAQALGVAPTP
ncbi:Transposase and inactivated derivatives, IS30 family [Saccharopolyspora shandongensis]|uniref:Transposase and inactivated derivatives, IS30 family n=1 Tax=Saccharopolyspora shandongensis TaxID=418495 RepID=A0A1H3FQM1_9PSEU|nr:Transposase and inactivated derivatives, IS30 family [Saccharopolyspora shandongensis]